MKTPILRKLIIPIAAAVALMAFQGLGYAQMLINGAGTSFPYPIYSKWFNEYARGSRHS